MKAPNFNDAYLSLPKRSKSTKILVVFLLVFMILLSYTAVGFRQGVENVREAQSDNRVWNITQLEVAFQRFTLSLDRAANSAVLNVLVPADSQKKLINDFDIFYSRVSTFLATVDSLGESEESASIVAEIEEIRTSFAQIIDTHAKANFSAAEISKLAELADNIAISIRDVSVKSLQIINRNTEAERLALLQKFRLFYTLVVTLISIAFVLFMLSLGIDRAQSDTIAKLQRSNVLMRVVLENSDTGIFLCDQNGRVLSSNFAASKIFGLDKGDILGSSLQDIVVPDHLRREYQRIIRFLSFKRSVREWSSESIRVVGKRQNGVSFPANVVVRKVTVSDNESVLILFIRDISEDVLSEQRLENALSSARMHAAAQERFLATMSHELRTPLHGVLAATDLLSLQALPSNARDLVEKTQISAQHALQQIGFSLGAISSDKVTEDLVVFDPHKLVEQVVEEARLVSEGSGTVFEFQLVGEWPEANLLGRPLSYHRALVNLVGNAAKFAKGGHVVVRLTCVVEESNDDMTLTTEVIDDGPGIPTERLSRIFEPFKKWYDNPAQTHQQTGFGLGLWIAQEAVSQLGGKLSVSSKTGTGTQFSFKHSLRLAAERQAHTHLEGPSIRLDSEKWSGQALVVDDSRINTELMARMVAELGYDVSVAHSGEEAVKAAVLTAFDLILMDFHMQELDGAEAVQYIRRSGASVNARILGITARIDLNPQNDQFPWGMDGVLRKPFGLSELRAKLVQVAASQMENDLKKVEKTASKDLASSVAQRAHDLGIPLLQDTCGEAWTAVFQAEQGNPMASSTAHKVAGAALMLGFDTLGDELLTLEEHLDADVNGKAILDTVLRVRNAIQEAEVELSHYQAKIQNSNL